VKPAEGEALNETDTEIRTISDTARWTAMHRAIESDRPDALFRDPWARRLAGSRGEQIAKAMAFSDNATWPFVTRTYLFDRMINQEIAQGVEMVINLAAGLDTRPYRMTLPASLKWVEVDLPEPLAEKQAILQDARPVCELTRVGLDLSNQAARRELFDELGKQATKVLVLCEGLLIYLTPEQVAALAEDLARPKSFRRWVIDLGSPGLVRMLQRQWQQQLEKASAPLIFGPAEGPPFFTPHGWKPIEVRTLLKEAARLGRLSFGMRLLALLPASTGKQGPRPWGGVVLLAKV
jgi:methyltransferase (TIGR00027 family)